MKTFFERAAKALSRDETPRIERMLRDVPRAARVLDVGSGFGRKLQLLFRLGFRQACGVEKNPALVEACRRRGLAVTSAEEFAEAPGGPYDLLVMSHVIEHMPVGEMLAFMDAYLDHLRPGGLLLVLTPLPGDDFWLDLDHVKPYSPQGFKDFFGKRDQQVQRFSRHELRLVDIDFRRSPLRARMRRSLLLKTPDAAVWRLVNLLLAVAFRLSGKLVGRRTAWIGLFRKR